MVLCMLLLMTVSQLLFLVVQLIHEPRCEKPAFCICKNKAADQLRGPVTAKLISAFVFA